MEFPAALQAAIAARGLPLHRIQQRLLARGSPVSVATLSYWQSGRTQPERASSLLALRNLEEILGVPAGGLARLLSRPRPRGLGRRESHMLPVGALWDHADRVGPLLSEVDWRWDEHLVRISQHDRCHVGADGGQVALWVRQVLMADQDGPDRWIVVWYGEQLPELRGLRNCRTGRVATGDGIMVAELLFDEPMRQGATLITEHELVYPRPSRSSSCERTFRMRGREYLLEILFHPGAVPAYCEERAEPVTGQARVRRLALDGAHSVHALAPDFGPGTLAISWRWA